MRTFFIKQQTKRLDGTGTSNTKIRREALASFNDAVNALVLDVSKQVEFYSEWMKGVSDLPIDVNADVGNASVIYPLTN